MAEHLYQYQLTITLSGVEDILVADVQEYSGVKTSGSFDMAANSHGGGPVVGPSITPSVSGELLVCVGGNGNYAFDSIDSPWTAVNLPGDLGFGDAYYIDAPLSVQSCIFEPAGSSTAPFDFATSAASFLPTGGPSDKQKASMFLVF